MHKRRKRKIEEMKSKRDYADIKKKEKTQKIEDKQNKHVNRRMKK